MKLSNLLALPPTVILLCTSSIAAEPEWPHNLPDHMKYFPEDERHVKRGLTVQEKMKNETPIGVKKMSSDESEMFFLDNWIFASDTQHSSRRSELESLANITSQFSSPLRPHSESTLLDSLLRFHAKSLLKRGFKCPENTNDCSSIGAPNSCCSTGSTCISIKDTGDGSVGCCPQGQDCDGTISCNTDKGFTSCPDSPNGGCCLPGYSCEDVGCVIAGTTVTHIQPSTTSSTSSSSTAVIVVPTTASSSATPSSSASSTSDACSSGWFSCAASLGGGCCQNGRTCATGASCIGGDSSVVSTVAPSAPVRPTSDAPSSSFPGESICPVGFYVCSAYYPSGCCRVGLDCQTSGSCVKTPSRTVINTNGVTIVAPSGANAATTAAPQGGSCPTSWYSCPASRGGNCCPNGYSCAEQCTATSGTSIEQKVAPSAATIPSIASAWALISSVVAIGVAMIVL